MREAVLVWSANAIARVQAEASASPPTKTATIDARPAPCRRTARPAPRAIARAIVRVLGARDGVCVITKRGVVLDLHVGRAPACRALTREEWERLVGAGVDLLPWTIVERMRISGSGGSA
jgi:hypothetical protein